MNPPADTVADVTSGRSPVELTPMSVPKASDVLAQELRERILSGQFPRG